MMCLTRLFLVGILASVLTTCGVAAETYTYPQLVRRMTDMRELARLPPVGETTAMASSYDRASRYDAAQDKYIHWDAKQDDTGTVRLEGNENVLADIRGPGCLWRIWGAGAGQGRVKIYLDGSATPTVDLPFIDYFSGQVEPFNRQNLVYELKKGVQPPGFDNYTPIPFQKSCKIVGDKGRVKRYQFTYTQFPAGTVVPSFQWKPLPEDAAALDRANEILGRCGQPPSPQASEARENASIQAEAGKETPVATLSGAGAITAIKVKLDLPKDAEAQRVLLSQLTLSITWDDEKTPAVWSPLGDFFGYVGGAVPFQSLPVGLLEDGTFYSYWYMPYRTKARLVVGNDSPQAVPMTWQITHAPLSLPLENLARFHAKWHRDAFLPDRPDRQPDWTLLTTQGRGRYVGTHLHGWNPLATLWGEGNDKFFVDGEKFPANFGTGTENYFGYSLRSPLLFSKPYHNQVLNENNENHFDDNRWHISDSVPFQTSFDGYLEKFPSNKRLTLYAAEVFWYLAAGGVDPYPAIPTADRVGWWKMPPIFREPDVIEGESLMAYNPNVSLLLIVNTRGADNLHSGGHELQWLPKKGENKTALKFPVAKSGKYHVILRYEIRHDHGQNTVQFSVDGKPMGPQLTLTGPKSILAPPADLGVVELTAGMHSLGVEFTQMILTNLPGKGPYLGLDYIKLVPAR